MKGSLPSIVTLPQPGEHLKAPFDQLYASGNSSRPQPFGNNLSWIEKLIAPPEFAGGTTTPSNEKIPAGDTYLGQFIAHEMTYQLADGIGLPSLQLDCLYGAGPDRAPYLYWYAPQPGIYNPLTFRGVKLLLNAQEVNGEIVAWDAMRLGTNQDYDGNRPPLALMADARNDRTFPLTQLHCAWALFHNAVAQFIFEQSQANQQPLSQTQLFYQTRQAVIECFRQVVVHDYLSKLIDPGIMEDIWDNNHFLLMDASPKKSILNQPVLMPEFLQAAFRFGHSQVREFYFLEWDFTKSHFEQTSRRIFGIDGKNDSDDLRGFRQYTRQRIDWRLFFDYGPHAKISPQHSKAIDQFIAYPLGRLPFLPHGNRSLVLRDAQKGAQLADALKYVKVLTDHFPNEFPGYKAGVPKPLIQKLGDIVGNASDAPLWLFLLLEADHFHQGQKLGPLGERIVAEQFVWVMKYGLAQEGKPGNLKKALAVTDQNLLAAIRKLRKRNAVNNSPNITMVDVLRFAGFNYPEEP